MRTLIDRFTCCTLFLSVQVCLSALAAAGEDKLGVNAQKPAAPDAAENGRYSLVVNANPSEYFFIDTRTGRIWVGRRITKEASRIDFQWEEQSSPVSPAGP
jgi:hypothetical protein